MKRGIREANFCTTCQTKCVDIHRLKFIHTQPEKKKEYPKRKLGWTSYLQRINSIAPLVYKYLQAHFKLKKCEN